jgi:UDP-N-acetylglucosamine 2-epimerase (non-hydrolysing)
MISEAEQAVGSSQLEIPMRVLSVLGTRPEVIKMAPVIKQLQHHGDAFKSIVCVTAQHRQMLDQMLDVFGIQPNVDLNLMTENQTLSSLTSMAMTALGDVMRRIQPHLVLVQGDTTTAMVAALAAFYQQIKVGHIEAGMRTHDPYNPFPEEINRRLISVLTALHFAPTRTAADALRAEGIASKSIIVTGSTAIDALKQTIAEPYTLDLAVPTNGRRLILVTAHRRESFGLGLRDICWALRDLVARNQNIEIVYPVHLNPNVRETVEEILSHIERVHLIEPLAYQPFAHLMNRAYLVLTDSGGVQGEAPALGKPVLILRRETEWPEAVQAGVAKLVGTDRTTIVTETERLLHDEEEYQHMARAVSPYGDGRAAQRIVQALIERRESTMI